MPQAEDTVAESSSVKQQASSASAGEIGRLTLSYLSVQWRYC